MKKTLVFLTVLLISATVNAQIRKNQFLVGGTASFASISSGGGGSSITQLELSPNFGYFVIDKFAIGAAVNFSSMSGGGETVSSSAFGPFLRYYFLPTDAKTNVFGQFGFIAGSVKSGGASVNLTGFSVAAGPSFFLTPNVALEVAAEYASVGASGAKQNTVGVVVGFQVHLGK